MRTEVRWKAVQRITQGRLARAMATCPLCSENRRIKTSQRPHKQDRAEGGVFAIGRGLISTARPLGAASNDQRDDPRRSEAALVIQKSSMPATGTLSEEYNVVASKNERVQQ
jgi:hypothetical protein